MVTPVRESACRRTHVSHVIPYLTPASLQATSSAENDSDWLGSRARPGTPPTQTDSAMSRDTFALSNPCASMSHTPANSADSGTEGSYHGALSTT